MTKRRLLLLIVIALAVTVFFAFDLERFLSLDFFKAQQATIEAYRNTYPWLSTGLFFVIYVAVTGLSLPKATVKP